MTFVNEKLNKKRESVSLGFISEPWWR